jgi:hypothetical protein
MTRDDQMIKKELERDFLNSQSLIKISNSQCKYFSIGQETRQFGLQLLISEKELQELITIQKQIESEFGIKKPLVEIAGRALEISLEETVKTCSLVCGD